MGPRVSAEDIADHLYWLSALEEGASSLYRDLAAKVELPVVKSIMLQISLDSQKHSTILSGILQSMFPLRKKFKGYGKSMKPIWETISKLFKEVRSKGRVIDKDVDSLLRRLELLESAFGEEYYMFVQIQTLDAMSEKIYEIYKLKLDNLHVMFEGIIRDEERHRELLGDVKKILLGTKEKKVDNAPLVRYQNPDAWRGP